MSEQTIGQTCIGGEGRWSMIFWKDAIAPQKSPCLKSLSATATRSSGEWPPAGWIELAPQNQTTGERKVF